MAAEFQACLALATRTYAEPRHAGELESAGVTEEPCSGRPPRPGLRLQPGPLGLGLLSWACWARWAGDRASRGGHGGQGGRGERRGNAVPRASWPAGRTGCSGCRPGRPARRCSATTRLETLACPAVLVKGAFLHYLIATLSEQEPRSAPELGPQWGGAAWTRRHGAPASTVTCPRHQHLVERPAEPIGVSSPHPGTGHGSHGTAGLEDEVCP